MCRIFGISYGGVEECIGTAKIARLLYRSLVHGGEDAWGYMLYDGDNVWHYKQPGRVDRKGPMDIISKHMRGNDTRWMCGHVRAATFGSPEENQNNHPLRHGEIMGVHNGTLVNHDDILKITGREDDTVEVDSEAIFAAVNKWGHAPGLRKIVGDMVTVYTDLRKPDRVHIGRSYGRYLTIGWTENGNLIWATEKQALEMLEGFGLKFTKFSSVQEMRHVVIRDGRIIYRNTYGTPPEHHSERMPYYLPATDWWSRTPVFHQPTIDLDEIIASHRPISIEEHDRLLLRQSLAEDLESNEPTFGQKVDEDTYYYHGRLMMADEYIDTLADEMEWEWVD